MEDYLNSKINDLAEKAAEEAPQKDAEASKKKAKVKLADMVKSFNERFQALSDMQFQTLSFVKTALNEFNDNLNQVRKAVRQNNVQTSVQDCSITALLEVLLEKGVLSEEEYKEKAQAVYNRAVTGKQSGGKDAKNS